MSEENKKIPVGDRIRAVIEPALDDPRRDEIQLKKLDDIFNAVATRLPKIFESDFDKFNNAVESETRRNPDSRNPMIIDALTSLGPDGEPLYNPIKKLGLPISTNFTQFAATDVNNLPGYVRLHEAARDMNVALKLIGVTAEESRGGGMGGQAVLIVDGSRNYEDGALENAMLSPQLPPRKVDFGKRSNDFDL